MLLIAVAGCITAYRDWQTPRTLNGQSAIFRSETLFFWVIITAAWLILESRLAGWMDDPLGSGARGYGYVSGARVLGLISGFTLASIPMSVSRFYSAGDRWSIRFVSDAACSGDVSSGPSARLSLSEQRWR